MFFTPEEWFKGASGASNKKSCCSNQSDAHDGIAHPTVLRSSSSTTISSMAPGTEARVVPGTWRYGTGTRYQVLYLQLVVPGSLVP